jgi:hypothetical protein
LCLVFFEDVGLDGTACLGEGVGFDFVVDVLGEDFVAGDAEEEEAQAVMAVGKGAFITRVGAGPAVRT